jgi:hypothetical protein
MVAIPARKHRVEDFQKERAYHLYARAWLDSMNQEAIIVHVS